MEIKNKTYGTPQNKSCKISQWKINGVICENFDMLFNEYIKTTQCQHCGKDFKSTKDRHLDHNHDTGEVRLIVCQKCNVMDSYIKYPNGYDRKSYEKQYKQTNKDFIKEQNKKYREKNKEILNEKIRTYYKENPQKLVDKRLKDAEKIECKCGLIIRKDSMSKHLKRKLHNVKYHNEL